MRTITQNIYKFSELPKPVQEKVLDKHRDWNVDGIDWWESVYEDAGMVGLRINGFDLYRQSIDLVVAPDTNTVDIAAKIVATHGEECDTYKAAAAYRVELAKYRLSGEDSDELDEIVGEATRVFMRGLRYAYLGLLQSDYDYLTSDEAVGESLEANDVEFCGDGRMI